MCVFALGLNTQANAQSLSSFMPEKNGFLTYTVEQYINYWEPKASDTLVYYVGGPLAWSAQNTKVSSTESVFDIVCREIPGTGGKSYRWIFADPDIIRTVISQYQKDVVPLKGEVRTAGISKKTGFIERFSRPARDNDIPFLLDWNILEQLPFDPPINLGADIVPVPVILSGCGNPYYAPSVGGGYKLGPPIVYNRNNEGYAQMPPSTGVEKYAEPEFVEEKVSAGNTYITQNYFPDEGEINYDQDEFGECRDSRLSFWLSLNISAGPIYVNPYSNFGYVGNQPGYYNGNYSQPYVCIGNQGYNGVPSISNVSYFNQTVNNIYNYNYNYNYNSTTIITNPPPVPPVVGNPIDPSTGDVAYEPIEPSNRTHAGFAKNKGISPVRGIRETPIAQTRGLANNSDFRPKTNLNPKTTFADSRPSSRPNSSNSKPESRPSQKPPNQFTRGPQQGQPQIDQVLQDQSRRPQEKSRMDYKPNSRGSSVDQGQVSRTPQSPRPSYGNGNPSRQIANNAGQPARGNNPPSDGRVNSGGRR